MNEELKSTVLSVFKNYCPEYKHSTIYGDELETYKVASYSGDLMVSFSARYRKPGVQDFQPAHLDMRLTISADKRIYYAESEISYHRQNIATTTGAGLTAKQQDMLDIYKAACEKVREAQREIANKENHVELIKKIKAGFTRVGRMQYIPDGR